jgi:hypothetical protein
MDDAAVRPGLTRRQDRRALEHDRMEIGPPPRQLPSHR